jgi:hypothetical protein
MDGQLATSIFIIRGGRPVCIAGEAVYLEAKITCDLILITIACLWTYQFEKLWPKTDAIADKMQSRIKSDTIFWRKHGNAVLIKMRYYARS